MRITLCESNNSGVIGREHASGGEFVLRHDGTVWYRNSLDPREWYAADGAASWKKAVAAVNERALAANAAGERELNAQLRAKLSELGCLTGRGAEFWTVVLEQVDAGLF